MWLILYNGFNGCFPAVPKSASIVTGFSGIAFENYFRQNASGGAAHSSLFIRLLQGERRFKNESHDGEDAWNRSALS